MRADPDAQRARAFRAHGRSRGRQRRAAGERAIDEAPATRSGIGDAFHASWRPDARVNVHAHGRPVLSARQVARICRTTAHSALVTTVLSTASSARTRSAGAKGPGERRGSARRPRVMRCSTNGVPHQ